MVVFVVAVLVLIAMVVVVVMRHIGRERGELEARRLDRLRQPERAAGVLLDQALPGRFQQRAVHDHQIRAGNRAHVVHRQFNRVDVRSGRREHPQLDRVARDLPRPIGDHAVGNDHAQRLDRRLLLDLGLLSCRSLLGRRGLLSRCGLLFGGGGLLGRRGRLLLRRIIAPAGGEQDGARERADREKETGHRGYHLDALLIRPSATPSGPRLRALWRGRASRLWRTRRRARSRR